MEATLRLSLYNQLTVIDPVTTLSSLEYFFNVQVSNVSCNVPSLFSTTTSATFIAIRPEEPDHHAPD